MHAPRRTAPSGAAWVTKALLAAVFVALRLPSLIEPNWYADEGTYADIGRALTHGAVLYRDVWDNKPPGMYWLAAGVIRVAGPAAPVFHIVLAAIVAAGAVAVWRIGIRIGGVAVATLATLVFVVLMSLPNLDGDLLNAEVAGGVLTLWAMALVLVRAPSRRRYVGAGVLIAAALTMKPVFAVDAIAVGAVPLWEARAAIRSSGEALRRSVPAFLVGVVGTAVLVVAAVGVTASLSGFIDVLIHQDVDYVQLTNGPGGSVVHDAGVRTRLVSTALLALRVGIPIAGAGIIAWRRSRAGQAAVAAVVWWLGCDAGGAMISARGLTHYAQQAEGALALATSLLAVTIWRRGGSGRPAALVVALMAWPLVELMLLLPRVEVAMANRDRFPPLEHHNFAAAQVWNYYAASGRRLAGRISAAEYDALFPYDATRAQTVVTLFQRHSHPGDRVFVWGSIHWVYALSDRVPAGRYVSLNDAYYVDPNSQQALEDELRGHPPAVLVADAPLPGGVLTQIHAQHYRKLSGAVGGDDVWLAATSP